MGGYCYLNFAAVAAQAFIADGAGRVAVLDVDYHHGNGTQSLFYRRGDVLVVNVHADPAHEFPYFLGYADERGEGPGEDANLNLPLKQGADWPDYAEALGAAARRIADFAPDALVLSLGFDTFSGDPLGKFCLETEDYARLGARVAALSRPTVIILEGGYNVEALGGNLAAFLTGFQDTG
jgi:acetoin utilization deacetylase AcuC-like enzyme